MDGTLTHVRLLVDEYRSCFEFYRVVLDLDVTFGGPESRDADFDTGEVTLALFDASEMAAAIDADPDGTLLELNEPLED